MPSSSLTSPTLLGYRSGADGCQGGGADDGGVHNPSGVRWMPKCLGSKHNGHTLHDGRTVHVDGGTKRDGKRRNLLGNTQPFLDSVSMDSGIVAFEVAVEKANAITGKNSFNELNGI